MKKQQISEELKSRVKGAALELEQINYSLAEELGSALPDKHFSLFDRASDVLLDYVGSGNERSRIKM